MSKQLQFDGIAASFRRKDYLGTPIHNSWRAFRTTDKGKAIGNDPSWDYFSNFYADMSPTYAEGLHLLRVDKSKPFSKGNCFWGDTFVSALGKTTTAILEYNGESMTLREWSIKIGCSLNGLRLRFHRGRGYTKEQILFGRKRVKRVWNDEDKIKTRASKLLASYRVRDFKRDQQFNIRKEWFVENILKQPCYYCGSGQRIGADRKDNTKGHTEENCVPCCHVCNAIRMDRFTVEEMSQIGQVVRKIRIRWN